MLLYFSSVDQCFYSVSVLCICGDFHLSFVVLIVWHQKREYYMGW